MTLFKSFLLLHVALLSTLCLADGAPRTAILNQVLRLFTGKQNKPAAAVTHQSEVDFTLCKVHSYNLTVEHKKCRPEIVPSRQCSGYCNSLYVPGNKDTLSMCKSCKVKTFHWETVQLQCRKGSRWRIRKFNYQVIDSCACILCDK
ncbi:DAN domain family member 5-like [Hydractinia symbiolongicarpus]|uniref:DAN domain family member 5-like n=1 Tax=Hydractinia symbiolongicarpus TaxID=13093 RepID=UPI00254FC841|nr:DAN domain family member 5-like [Hydractinia symbiolongicarpus]